MVDRSSKPKRPRDANQLAKLITDIATGQVEDEDDDPDSGKDPAAVSLGRRGGLKGGKARAEKLTPEQRREIAKKGAAKRWGESDG
jgi:hypothetical protein